MPLPIAILVAGEPIASVLSTRGGYASLIRTAASASWPGEWTEVDLRDGSTLPEPSEVSGVVVTGSASSVTDREPWVLRAEEHLRVLVRERVPTFGICFGHQMLGQALGGEVAKNPLGREIGTVDLVIQAEDPLLDGLVPPLRANATHVDTVSRLPPGAKVLARSAREPHAAVRFGERAWGVQFHPEMDAAVIREFISARRDVIASEGQDPDFLLRATDDGVAGQSTLRRFLALVAQASPG
jgi:GMP synthase (glutamine-hydrolysing)